MGLTGKKGLVSKAVTGHVTVTLPRELAEQLSTALTHALDTATVGGKGKGKSLRSSIKSFKHIAFK